MDHKGSQGEERRLRAVLEGIGHLLGRDLDEAALLREVLRIAVELVDADLSGLYLYEGRTDELVLREAFNMPEELRAIRLRADEGLSGTVFQEGKARYVNDYAAWSDRSEEWVRVGLRAALAVPLSVGGRRIGVLSVGRFTPRAEGFADEEVVLLQMLADYAAAALEQLRLRGVQREFLTIGARLLTTSRLQPLLRDIVRALVEHSPFRTAAVAVFRQPMPPDDPEPPEIQTFHLEGLSEEDEQRLRRLARERKLIPTKQIVEKGHRLGTAYFVTPQEVPELLTAGVPIETKAQPGGRARWGEHDTLVYLLEIEGRIFGRITLANPAHGQIPTPEELGPLEMFVQLAAFAVQRARYRRRLQGLYTLSERLVQSDDLDTLIEQAVRMIRENFTYDHITLFLREGEELVLHGYDSVLPEGEIDFESFGRIPIDRGITGWVARHGEPLLVGDVLEDPRYLAGHPRIRSELAVPVAEGGQLLGVLNIESVRENAFTEEDQELLGSLARQLAVAIRSLRRRESLKEAVEERERINQFLRALNEAEDLEKVLRMVLEHGMRLLAPKADAGSVIVYNERSRLYEFRVAVGRNVEKILKIRYREEEILRLLKRDRPVILTRSLQERSPVTRKIQEQMGEPAPGSTLSIPICDSESGRPIAFFNLNNLDEEGVFTEEDAEALWQLVPEITAAVLRVRDRDRLRDLALHDPLTGAYNRHYFTEFIRREEGRARRRGHPISLVMIDIDSFYEINDRFGHLEGDRILREMARIFMANVRSEDVVVRYGGDEFLIVMPQTSHEEAERVTERLQQRLKEWDPGLPGFHPSISVGVAGWRPDGEESLDRVLERADGFMYHRREGRGAERRRRKRSIVFSAKPLNPKDPSPRSR